uniref:Uncharacterized protein n=1 Tax=Magallana gigas TaxID=29159 RepID=K1PYY4_MAGGI
MENKYLTVLEKEDEPPSDLQVPYANAGFLLPTSAAFPSPPADPECLTSQNEASPPPPSSSVAPRMTIPLTIECTPRCLLGPRELRGRQMGEDPDTWSAEMSMQRNSAQDAFMSQEVQQLDAKPQAERKLPLIKDADDIYKDVLVNPATLRTAEMKALTAKNPAIYLLNKVLDLLRNTKGARGLDKHKMDTLKGTPATLMDCTHWRKTLVVLGQSGNLLSSPQLNSGNKCEHFLWTQNHTSVISKLTACDISLSFKCPQDLRMIKKGHFDER